MWIKILCVGAGGFLGSVGRYTIGLGLSRWLSPERMPIGTLAVNLLGCLVIGYLAGLRDWSTEQPTLYVFVMVGVLGGLTTFSSFGNETFQLFLAGHAGLAMLNIALSVMGGLLAVWAGFSAARFLA